MSLLISIGFDWSSYSLLVPLSHRFHRIQNKLLYTVQLLVIQLDSGEVIVIVLGQWWVAVDQDDGSISGQEVM